MADEAPQQASDEKSAEKPSITTVKQVDSSPQKPKDLEQAVMAEKFVPLPTTTRENIPVMSGLDHRPTARLPQHHNPLLLENAHPQTSLPGTGGSSARPSTEELLPKKYIDPVSEEYKVFMKNKFGSTKIFLDHNNQLF
ncbi:hypothetical protein HYW21_09060 [Candidatus Woesearchaeota archaeon]|nr:hypothetical protein [Candidatus Woesearchaeota archaeon]